MRNKELRVIETFFPIEDYEILNWENYQPSCVNGSLNIEKYRITIEKIDEPKQIIKDRLRLLLRKCKNFHHYEAFQKKAKKLNIKINMNEYGIEKKKGSLDCE